MNITHESMMTLTADMPCKVVSYARAAELLEYNPETGEFTWKVYLDCARRRHGMSGKKACSVNADGYISIMIDGRNYPAHRLAFLLVTGYFPDKQVDHINHIRDDNRWENLREFDHIQNSRNLAMPRHNTSGATGVSWFRSGGKWRAYISRDRKQINLGLFEDFFDAVCARKSAEVAMGFDPLHGTPKDVQYRYRTPNGRTAA